MKKILISLVIIMSIATASSASIIIQAQGNSMGAGVGAGFSVSAIPLLLDLGIEANAAQTPLTYSEKGSYTDDLTKTRVEYDGTLSCRGIRYGVFAKFNLILISPVIHAGAQEANLTLDGDLRIPGEGTSVSEVGKLYGSYISLGLPFYLGPLFIEPSFGTQSIFIPHYANIKVVPEFQISCGLSIL